MNKNPKTSQRNHDKVVIKQKRDFNLTADKL
jgi:hypothetical protein